MAKGRFDFPGFSHSRNEDSSTHHVEIGTVESGGHVFVLTMIRNAHFPNLSFLVASVADAHKKELWGFTRENFAGAGVLAKAGDAIVIALVGRGKDGTVERVIPLQSFVSHQQYDLRQLMTLKRTAAEYLGREYTLTPTEGHLVQADLRRQQELQRTEGEVAAAAREQARLERIRKMLARGRITCYTPEGRRRYGIPVLEHEWMSVTSGTHVVIVRSVNDVTGEIGEPIEAFQIVKERGKDPKKGFAAKVTKEPPLVKTAEPLIIRPIRTAIVDMDGRPFEVKLFASMDQIRAARLNGLINGTYVAVDCPGKLEVYAAYRDRMDTMGQFETI